MTGRPRDWARPPHPQLAGRLAAALADLAAAAEAADPALAGPVRRLLADLAADTAAGAAARRLDPTGPARPTKGATMGTVTPFRPRIPGRPPPDPRHPRWDDGTPVLIGQPVRHADNGWSGVVDGVPPPTRSWSPGPTATAGPTPPSTPPTARTARPAGRPRGPRRMTPRHCPACWRPVPTVAGRVAARPPDPRPAPAAAPAARRPRRHRRARPRRQARAGRRPVPPDPDVLARSDRTVRVLLVPDPDALARLDRVEAVDARPDPATGGLRWNVWGVALLTMLLPRRPVPSPGVRHRRSSETSLAFCGDRDDARLIAAALRLLAGLRAAGS